MKLPSISSIIHDKRGEVGTIAVLIGMVVIGLGILVGSQLRNQNINIAPRASEKINPSWSGALSSKTVDSASDTYLWSSAGPTTGWESYIGNRAYLCNGKWCWTFDRAASPPALTNGGKPFDMTKETGYKDLKSPPSSDIKPWSGNGPTAAWTWILPYNGYTINETMLCNGIYCWRHIRYPDNAVNQTSGWRDGGLPVNMKDKDVWKADTKMWEGSGLSVGWNDPINSKATLCNESKNYCRSMSYANGQWAWLNDAVKYPSGVTKFTSAWTSPATNIQTRCTANLCYNFDSSTNVYEVESFLIAAQPTSVPIDSCNSSADCMKCGSTCVNNTAEIACTAMVQNFTCSCVSNKCVKVDTPQTGSLKVIIPSAPSGAQWRRTNTAGGWDAWRNNNFTDTAVPVGTFTVEFAEVTGYTRPSETSVQITNGQATTLNAAAYVLKTGSLKVSIPNAPTGAQWRRTNTAGGWDAWRNNNFTDTAVPVGTFTVEFAEVTGYTRPSETSVQITNGQTTTLNAAAYVQQVGSIKVTIGGTPPTDAQWRRSTTPIQTWKNSGTVESGVPIGDHVIEFKGIQGYDKPIDLTGVTVLNNKTVEKTSTAYVRQTGSLKVSITNAPTGAQWRRTNTAGGWDVWRNNNFTDTAIPTGTYNVEFMDVDDYTKPSTITGIVISSNTLSTQTGAYVADCIPSLISPANNASITTNPSFEWSACSGTGTKYRIEVTGNTTPNTVNFVGTTYSFTNPVPWIAGKTYTWKVKACSNSDCNGGTFSPPSTFTYNTIGTITLTSPINQVVIPRGNVTLQWSAATNATSYDWKISRTVQDYKTGTSNTTSAVTSLIPGSYKWQVTAKGASGTRESSFGEFKIPFSKIKPLNNPQITYGSSYLFEWTPLLSTDMSILNFAIYNSTNSTTPVYFKQLSTSSSEYTSGRINLLLNTNTDPDFVAGRSYTWQLVATRAGTSQENTPPNDTTVLPQSFSLVAAPTTVVPTAGTTTAPATVAPTARPTSIPPTAVATIPNATATTVPCTKKGMGDANCDGIINYVDFVCWKGELNRNKPTNCISSDFDNSGAINSFDYNLWRNTFITSINPIP